MAVGLGSGQCPLTPQVAWGSGPKGSPGCLDTLFVHSLLSVSTAARLDLQAHTWFLNNQLSVKCLLHS